jgi:hypothetical protein
LEGRRHSCVFLIAVGINPHLDGVVCIGRHGWEWHLTGASFKLAPLTLGYLEGSFEINGLIKQFGVDATG